MSYGFLNGTQIETGFGSRAIENVRPGDRLLTLAGKMTRVAWIWQTRLSVREVAHVPGMKPVRLRTASLWPTSPSRDLVMAPDQGVLLSTGSGSAESRLKTAKNVPFASTRLPVTTDMTFTQLCLEQDGLILANSVWCQSLPIDAAIDSCGYETQSVTQRLAS